MGDLLRTILDKDSGAFAPGARAVGLGLPFARLARRDFRIERDVVMKKAERIAGDTRHTWNKFAGWLAEEAHEENMSSHWGVGPIGASALNDKVVGFYVYDNHPYKDPERRPREHAELIAFLETRKCKRVATGTYGENGYSIVHIFVADDAENIDEAFVERLRQLARDKHHEILNREIVKSLVAGQAN